MQGKGGYCWCSSSVEKKIRVRERVKVNCSVVLGVGERRAGERKEMAWSRLLFFCLRCARALAARSVPSIMAWHGPCLRLPARMVRGIAELWPG